MKLFIYCAGGFGREVYDTAKRANALSKRWESIGFIDDFIASHAVDFYGTRSYRLPYVLQQHALDSFEVVIANGEPAHRQTLYDKLQLQAVRLGTVVDPSAIVSDAAALSPGLIVTPFCSIASQARVGVNVAINTKSIVGHDIVVGDHAVISSMVNIGGACTVGARTYIGMGAQIKEGLHMGSDVIIGMGSVVYSDLPDGVIALGNPARVVRANTEKRVFGKK